MRAASLLLLSACAAGAPRGGPLVDHARWVAGDDAVDPFPDHRPADDACPEGSFYEEYGGLEIDAARCRYLVITQPSLVRVAAGDAIELYAYHAALVPPEGETGATAHVAVALDGDVVWEVTVPLPAQPEPWPVSVTAARDVDAGAPVVIHLHNHGANKYTFLGVEAVPPGAE